VEIVLEKESKSELLEIAVEEETVIKFDFSILIIYR